MVINLAAFFIQSLVSLTRSYSHLSQVIHKPQYTILLTLTATIIQTKYLLTIYIELKRKKWDI